MAYESGKLTGEDQSKIQRWALGYYKFSEKREQADRDYELKKMLHFLLRATSREFYNAVFPSVEVDDPDVVPGHTYSVDDLEGLEKLLDKIGLLQTKTQASLNGSGDWTEWR